ncbi:hypothetical protein I7I48_01502 [Histoplasma ohiense]|nr:hypothetical protein I7I48_01502 [Histoplasma ohiense (nom. inval.)]
MLEAFLSRKSLENWRSFFSNPHHQESERLDNLWLLSTPAFDAIRKGQVHFKVKTWVNNPDRTRKQTYFVGSNTFTRGPNVLRSLSTDTMVLENRTPQLTPILDEELFGFHARFSKVLAWMAPKSI